MLQRGYPVADLDDLAVTAAAAGDAGALEHLFGIGLRLSPADANEALHEAITGGHLDAADVVYAHMEQHMEQPANAAQPHPAAYSAADLATQAAKGGRPAVMEWLLQRFGTAVVLTPATLSAACASGSVELLSWLRERGCPWDARAFAAAVAAGSEEQLEWLAERGCPMPDGEDRDTLFVRACANGDLPTLRCLKRLGCAWRPGEDVFTRALKVIAFDRRPSPVPALRWLLEQGCRVDWRAAEAAVRYWEGLRPDLEAALDTLRAEVRRTFG